MFKKFTIVAATALTLSASLVAPSFGQSAVIEAACAQSSAACIAAVRAALGVNPTPAQIAAVVGSLNGLNLNNPAIATNVAAAISDAASLSTDPVQQQVLTQVAAAVEQGGDTATAAIDTVDASAV